MGPAQTYKGETDPDETLIARVKAGEQLAFSILVHRYEGPLFNYLRRLLHNAADAEDVFQETFLRVYQQARRFRDGAPFRPWLYRIATNAANDRLRKRGRRAEVSLDGSPGLASALPSKKNSPDAAAREAETIARLESAISGLPMKQRAVFLMARYEGMAYAGIAEALQIPVGTVKSRMNKAVQYLMHAMKDNTP